MNTVKARVGKGDFRARRAQAKHKQSVLTGDGWFFFGSQRAFWTAVRKQVRKARLG